MGSWKFDKVIVVDLEATCWETPEETAQNTSEIIEIGVCELNAMTGEILRPRGILIKPQHSTVSEFCTRLTSITPEMVNMGITFTEAIAILKKEYQVSRCILAAYGNYDRNMLERECERHGIKPPFGPTYLNISALATLKLKANTRLGLEEACTRFGLTFEGRLHRGVDDAAMAARVLWKVIG